MKKPDTIFNEIRATRCRSEEITKDMTAVERIAYSNNRGEIAAQSMALRSPRRGLGALRYKESQLKLGRLKGVVVLW